MLPEITKVSVIYIRKINPHDIAFFHDKTKTQDSQFNKRNGARNLACQSNNPVGGIISSQNTLGGRGEDATGGRART
jgi:hypothetical protein